MICGLMSAWYSPLIGSAARRYVDVGGPDRPASSGDLDFIGPEPLERPLPRHRPAGDHPEARVLGRTDPFRQRPVADDDRRAGKRLPQIAAGIRKPLAGDRPPARRHGDLIEPALVDPAREEPLEEQ